MWSGTMQVFCKKKIPGTFQLPGNLINLHKSLVIHNSLFTLIGRYTRINSSNLVSANRGEA